MVQRLTTLFFASALVIGGGTSAVNKSLLPNASAQDTPPSALNAASEIKSNNRNVVSEKAALSIDEDHKNFGTLREGEKVDIEYTLTNTTDTDVNITAIRPTCGCTAADDNPNVVPAGDSVAIKLTFDSKGRPGKSFKSARIMTDDPEQPIYRVSFEGDVTTELEFKEKMLTFESVEQGASVTEQLTMIYTGEEDLEIIEASADRDYITVELVKTDTMTDANSGDKATGYLFDVTLTDKAPEGNLYGAVTVKTNHPQKDTMSVSYRGDVKGEISISPNQLVAVASTNSTVKRGLSLTANKAKSFEIISITPPDNITMTTTVEELDTPQTKRLLAEFEAGDSVGRQTGDVALLVKLDGEEKTIKIPAMLITRQSRANRTR